MTMQIAIRGTDGLVLASDRKVRDIDFAVTARSQVSGTHDSSKIIFSKKHGIAVATAGSGEYVNDAGKSLVACLDGIDQLPDDLGATLEKWGDEFYIGKMGADSRQARCVPLSTVMVVNPDESAPFWKVLVSHESSAGVSSNLMISGHEENPAVFWAQYLRADAAAEPGTKGMTVKQLCVVAAMVIYSAGEINSYGVGRLEIHTFRDGNWETLPDSEIAKLRQGYDGAMRPIKRLLSRA